MILDLDSFISDAPQFFSAWTRSWPVNVFARTYCRDPAKAIVNPGNGSFWHDKPTSGVRFEAKSEVNAEHGVATYTDEQLKMLKDIPLHTRVVLFRNERNHGSDDRRWTFSNEE